MTQPIEQCQHGQVKGVCNFPGCPDGIRPNRAPDAGPPEITQLGIDARIALAYWLDPNNSAYHSFSDDIKQLILRIGHHLPEEMKGLDAEIVRLVDASKREFVLEEKAAELADYYECQERARKKHAAKKSAEIVATLRGSLFDAGDINDIKVEYLVHSLLAKDSLAWMYGDPGCYKSFVALDIAASVALGAGVDWAGAPTKQGPVLYIAAEGSAGMAKRKRAWEAMTGKSLDGQLKFLTMAIRITEEGFLDELIAICQEIRPALIVIDTQSRVTPGLEENGSVMSTYVEAVTALRLATGACVLTLHHTTKGTDVLRGHGSLYGAADTVLYVAKAAGAETERFAKVSIKKQKDDRDDLFWNIRMQVQHFCGLPADQEHDSAQCSSLVVRSANWSEVINAQATALDRVLLVVRQLEPLQSITTAQMAELTGLPPSTTRNALGTLCDQGELEKSGSGKNTAYLRPAVKITDDSASSASFRQPG
ncbi:AAA family ATPase [Streptomyces vastus]|uniref:HTH iclR-type domain-containing protein n=1 Tax=Streptomyces vastus TaxID=285451 RepID=A0ABP6E142_9ACTN